MKFFKRDKQKNFEKKLIRIEKRIKKMIIQLDDKIKTSSFPLNVSYEFGKVILEEVYDMVLQEHHKDD